MPYCFIGAVVGWPAEIIYWPVQRQLFNNGRVEECTLRLQTLTTGRFSFGSMGQQPIVKIDFIWVPAVPFLWAGLLINL